MQKNKNSSNSKLSSSLSALFKEIGKIIIRIERKSWILMSDEELRKQFGQEGMAKGQAREIEHLIEKWFSVLVSWMDATVPVQAS